MSGRVLEFWHPARELELHVHWLCCSNAVSPHGVLLARSCHRLQGISNRGCGFRSYEMKARRRRRAQFRCAGLWIVKIASRSLAEYAAISRGGATNVTLSTGPQRTATCELTVASLTLPLCPLNEQADAGGTVGIAKPPSREGGRRGIVPMICHPDWSIGSNAIRAHRRRELPY
jgi:hypothetical protein